MGPLCPVFGKMKHLGKNKTYEIKSFRVWVHWSDGDWTAETKKSFDNSEQRYLTENLNSRNLPR